MKNVNNVIGIIGLGYVGLPLCLEFGRHFKTIGFDINRKRILGCRDKSDINLESSKDDFLKAEHATFTHDHLDLNACNIYIVTVPTPITHSKMPDFGPLIGACKLIGDVISKEDIVIFESTVYPGATEDVCIPIIEERSKYIYNEDFFAGYSPERINPGDKVNRLPNIVKVTSGSTPEIANRVANLYSVVVKVGVYKAPSIKVAEASKVVENIQRDVNIAFMNELFMIFSKLNIDTHEVLEAAKTKWNFLDFQPGFVGGHCISVDPYYLIKKAGEAGIIPDIILASRKINEAIPSVVGEQLLERIDDQRLPRREAKILILGFAFKENCPDIRNTKVADLVEYLDRKVGCVDVYDPNVSPLDAVDHFGINLIQDPGADYDAIFIAVGHDQFRDLGLSKIIEFGKQNAVIFDYKNIFRDDIGR
jgi:UDP-N-acetyl-D-galactosamine dehydrogenase|tara:strand:- start:14063 stop:15325 length:1263 start_codon:yes stop_codon:yes gene_type:complete